MRSLHFLQLCHASAQELSEVHLLLHVLHTNSPKTCLFPWYGVRPFFTLYRCLYFGFEVDPFFRMADFDVVGNCSAFEADDVDGFVVICFGLANGLILFWSTRLPVAVLSLCELVDD